MAENVQQQELSRETMVLVWPMLGDGPCARLQMWVEEIPAVEVTLKSDEFQPIPAVDLFVTTPRYKRMQQTLGLSESLYEEGR